VPSLAAVIAGAYFALFLLALLWNLATSIIALARDALQSRTFPDQPPPLEPDVVVTLVHGTWARRAAWTLPSSPLCRTLSQAVRGRVAFEPFAWSGGNSIAARRRAVERLVAQLHSLVAQWPRARHYLVGHSHGGNVAFQALADPVVKERITGLACLSTPFLSAAPRDLGPIGEIVLWWLPVVMLFYGGVIALALLLPAYSDTLGPVLLLVAIATGFLTARSTTRLSSSVFAALAYPTVDPARVLILRTTADEAAAALGATHVISWLAGRIWLSTSRALGRTIETLERWRDRLMRHWPRTLLVAVCGIAVCCAAVFSDFGASSPAWWTATVSVSAVALLLLVATLARGGLVADIVGRIVFAMAAMPFLVAIALLGMGVGPELLIAGLLFQVTAETTPPGRWVVWQVVAGTSAESASGDTSMMHSASYQDQGALEILGQWISDVEEQARR
jgi:pimeloyl-ACP methyl ester carboxylesterase